MVLVNMRLNRFPEALTFLYGASIVDRWEGRLWQKKCVNYRISVLRVNSGTSSIAYSMGCLIVLCFFTVFVYHSHVSDSSDYEVLAGPWDATLGLLGNYIIAGRRRGLRRFCSIIQECLVRD